MDARAMQKLLAHKSPEPGVVAASVYAGGKCISDIAIDEAGKWAKKTWSRCLDRPVRAEP